MQILADRIRERENDPTLKENTFSDVCAGSPTEVASNERADGQEDELQQRPPAFEKASDTDHPRMPVSLSGSLLKENGIVGTRNRFSQTASQKDTSAGVSAAKLSNETDFVSRLLKDQQA
ncbi:uncharacterized protein K441DRAFT_674129 [Cenococcum geophilum 1.58]|uniref:uncharacterized protein n=1 Tax=Cenococcum geophilum 1.58 TaxID=794803 RepID=UPI00358F3120|nr:hypothetical protein K441DRAFT_674129 [Cenococcum geophilum 1.58]